MSSEQWLTLSEATNIVRVHLGSSVGRAEAVTRAALASSEVRFDPPVLLFTEVNGIVDFSLRPGPMLERDRASPIEEYQISKDDLLDWLDRQHPLEAEQITIASARFPGDAALIEEGRRMLAGGKHKRAVARDLAERAEGAGTFESKVDRLRRLL
jgi:hypothetical protein